MGLMDAISTTNDPNQAPSINGGLMNLFANPQTAGLLGAAGGLLSMSGPSRLPVSMGQALGAGMQGAQQGYTNALNTQRQIFQMGALQGLQGLMSGSAEQASQPSASSLFGPSSAAPASMGDVGGSPAGLSASGAPQSTATIFGRSPQQLFQYGLAMNMAGMQGGGDLMRIAVEHDPTLAAQMPTDITKMGVQGGMSPAQIQAANAAGVNKANYIAPVNARPGAILRDPLTMQPMAFNPNIPAGGTPLFDASGNVVGINSIPGAAGITQQMSAAKTAGEGSQLPYAGVDAQGNPLPVTNRTAAATQGVGSAGAIPGIANNNPGNLKDPQTGQFQAFPTQQAGIAAADQNLLSYQTQHGINTVAGIANRWAPAGDGNNDPAAYAAAITKATGFGPNQKLDLTSPNVRQTLLNAMFDVETPGWRDAGNRPGSPAQGGAIYSQAPLGARANAEAQAKGQVDTMNASYKEARQARSTGQNALTMLDDMSNFAQTKSPALANKLYNVQGVFSSDAQLFDKARDNLITQVSGSTGMSTDAARSIVNGAIPSYGMNPQAIQTGLGQIKAQVQMRMLKGDYLSDAYFNGDAPAYNQRENQFDQVMTPAAAAIIKMPSGVARNQAIAAAKNNPQDAQALRWGLNVGLLH